MSHSSEPQNEGLVSLADLFRLVGGKKWRIVGCGLVAAMLLGGWSLMRGQGYRAEATFLEKSGGGNTSVSGLLGILSGGSGGGDKDNAIALLKSKRLWTPLVQRYQLQASVTEIPSSQTQLQQILDNLQVEQAYLQKKTGPIFPDKKPPLVLQDVVYTGEIPLDLTIRFTDNDHFEVEGPAHEMPIQGQLGRPWQGPLASITLQRAETPSLAGRQFSLSFTPMNTVAQALSNSLKLTKGDKGENSLRLAFTYPDRHFASLLLNSLMDEYCSYLQAEHENLADGQLAYLERRRLDSSNNLLALITDYASELSQELPNSGIVDSQVELEGLQRQKASLRQRLMGIDLELRRLGDKHNDREGYLDTLGAVPQLPELVRFTIADINDLKQRRDRLALALRKKDELPENQSEEQFGKQILDLEEIRANMDQIRTLQNQIAEELFLPPPTTVSMHSVPILKVWYQKVYEANQARYNSNGKPDSPEENTWRETKGHFLSYLNSFLRLSNVQQRLVQQRLALQHSPGQELQGVDLDTANTLYVGLTQQQSNIQAEIRQNNFIIEQVKDPTFEISSLSGTLADPVSQGLISKSSGQSMLLKDSAIRSPKELERIKEELAQQRTFLLFHLQQANQLLQLREDFLNQKIHATQEVMLDLIQQQVSVSEKHLEDYTEAHLEQLKQERGYINQILSEINHEMALLPHKWVAEQMIKHQTKISGALVEEVTKLVESKNISHHLETVQSGPLDAAVVPLLPTRPNVLLFAILGALLGSGLATTWVICTGLWEGIEVSEANLGLAGQQFAGTLPKAKDRSNFNPLQNRQQLATLRRITAHLCQGETQGPWDKFVLLLVGRGVDYSDALSMLLAKKGYKVLKLELSFDHASSPEHQPGLLQVLDGTAPEPKIISGEHFDTIDAGGISLYGHELLHSRRFRDLGQLLATQYDWIVAVKHVRPISAEAESLCHLFHRIAITVSKEKLSQLEPYTRLASSGRAWVIFVASSAKKQ